MAELGPGVTGGELPVDGPLVGVDGVSPVAELVVECIDVGDPSGEALARECGGVVCEFVKYPTPSVHGVR